MTKYVWKVKPELFGVRRIARLEAQLFEHPVPGTVCAMRPVAGGYEVAYRSAVADIRPRELLLPELESRRRVVSQVG